MPKYLFVTGRLAHRALERTVEPLDLEGGYRIEPLGITVAALMNTDFIARHLNGVEEEVLVIPGFCKGPLDVIEKACGCRVIKGPKDLKEIPQFFGRSEIAQVTTEPGLKILAEIVEAPQMTVSEILKRARYYRDNGADIIDVGTDIQGDFKHLKEAVYALKEAEHMVSIDSMRPGDILAAVEAGADMVLSINSSNMEVAAVLDCPMVVIPDDDRDLGSLFTNVEKLLALGKKVIIDPILPPLLFGFVEGIDRYIKVREKYPRAPVLMGTGNVTELTDADTTGINALLVGMATELKIDYLLTTECSARARGAVKEISIARQLMHKAKESGLLPKHLDYSLLTVKDPRLSPYTEAELREMQSLLKDRNYRIFTDENYIYIFNLHLFLCGKEADSLFEKLEVNDPAHAFYLGRELGKAELAIKLGKGYLQDSELRWGYLNDY
ncbi:MAG: dihydropteroate synthase [Firmicutes bacterium]|nr:dihydropteroate synthase [Bacillota bacterium]